MSENPPRQCHNVAQSMKSLFISADIELEDQIFGQETNETCHLNILAIGAMFVFG